MKLRWSGASVNCLLALAYGCSMKEVDEADIPMTMVVPRSGRLATAAPLVDVIVHNLHSGTF